MLRHLGYVGQNLSLGITTGRGTVLRNATPERLRLLIRQNLEALGQILAFNGRHDVHLFRISSRVIPFASHPANLLDWWVEFQRELEEIGSFIQANGMRVSLHPGRYSVLNSFDPGIVAAAVRDFEWHARFLDSMGLGAEHKVVLHGGGAYGDKPAAMERFVASVQGLPRFVQRRLVLENDERLYTVEDALALSERTRLPVVVDLLHHRSNPGNCPGLHPLLERCFSTWRPSDGLPKIHFSSQAPGRRPGSHAEYVDAGEFIRFYHQVADLDFDCMLEAKAKDLALFKLRAEVGELLLAA